MNYFHASHDERDEIVIHTDDPCSDRACDEDHYVVLTKDSWNDVVFLLDRVGVLSSRIEYVKMPETDDD